MSWIETFSDKKFNILNCLEDDVCIEDIAHSLSMQCRFNGHCDNFYSVAEHSIHVLDVYIDLLKYIDIKNMTKQILLFAFLHDASESYLCDLPKPIKPYLKEYKNIENKIQSLIYKKFSVDEDIINNHIKYYNGLENFDINSYLKKADILMLHTEAKQLNLNQDKSWDNSEKYEYFHYPIINYSPEEVRFVFLDTYNKIMNRKYINE